MYVEMSPISLIVASNIGSTVRHSWQILPTLSECCLHITRYCGIMDNKIELYI